MASQITHVVYGKKIFDRIINSKIKDVNFIKYIIGCVFPDIRYLRTVPREATHIYNPTVEGLLKLNNSFELGTYAHSLLDYDREVMLKQLGLYDFVEKNQVTSFALKLIEDKVLYPEITNWEEISNFFTITLDEEKKITNEESVLHWHSILRTYFLNPNELSHLPSELNIPSELWNKIMDTYCRLVKESKILNVIQKCYQSLYSD